MLWDCIQIYRMRQELKLLKQLPCADWICCVNVLFRIRNCQKIVSACKFMHEIEVNFLQSWKLQLLAWFRYTNNRFLYGFVQFLGDLNNFNKSFKWIQERKCPIFGYYSESLKGSFNNWFMYQRSSYRHQNLHFTPSNPYNIKQSNIKIEQNRLKHNVSRFRDQKKS